MTTIEKLDKSINTYYIISIVIFVIALLTLIFVSQFNFKSKQVVVQLDFLPHLDTKHKIINFKVPNLNKDRDIIESNLANYVKLIYNRSTNSIYNSRNYINNTIKKIDIPQNYKLITQIRSILFLDNNTAKVTFDLKIKKLNSNLPDLEEFNQEEKVVTIKFGFKDLARSDYEFSLNPYNFQVYSYKEM